MALRIKDLDVFQNYDDVLREKNRKQAQQNARNLEAEKKSIAAQKEKEDKIASYLQNLNLAAGETSSDYLDKLSATGQMDTQTKLYYDAKRKAQGEDPMLNYTEKTAEEIYDAYATDQELYDEAFTIEKWYQEYQLGNVPYDAHKMDVYNRKKNAERAQQVAKEARNEKVQLKDITLYNTFSQYEKELFAVYRQQINRQTKDATDAEKYFDEKYGKGTAKNIAETLTRKENAERAQKVKEYATQHTQSGDVLIASPARALVTPIISAADQIGQYVAGKVGATTGRYEGLDPYSVGQIPGIYADAVIRKEGQNFEDILATTVEIHGGDEEAKRITRNIANVVYTAGESAFENIVRIAVLKGYGALALAGVAGFSQGVQQATLQGATADQAMAFGLVTGASEVLTEKIPLDNLMGALKSAGSKQSFMQILTGALKQAGIEATTEELNFLAGLMGEAIILQEKSGYEQMISQLVAEGVPYNEAVSRANKALVEEAGQVALQSALSGFMTSAGTGVATNMGIDTFTDAADQYEQQKENGRDKLQSILDGINPQKAAQGMMTQQQAQGPVVGVQGAQEGTQNNGVNISDILDETLAQTNGAPENPVQTAVETFETNGTISNKQASDILNSARAVQQLVMEGNLPKLEGMSLAQKRQAVKTAVQVMVENKSAASVDTAARTDYDNNMNEGGTIDATRQAMDNSGVRWGEQVDSQGETSGGTENGRRDVQLGNQGGLYGRYGEETLYSSDNEGRQLTTEQAEKIRDTAVVDNSGAPIALYHITDNTEFTNFAKGDVGFHFGSLEQATSRGKQRKYENGRMFRAYLNIKNPARATNDIMGWNPGGAALRLWADGVLSEMEMKEITALYKMGDGYDSASAVKLREILEGKGYDGIVYPNAFEGDGDSYIAFRDDQIIRSDVTEFGNVEQKNGAVGAAEEGFSGDLYRQIYEHGNIPEGENAVRPDVLTKSTDGNDKVSYTARTALEAKVTPEEFADLIGKETAKGRFSYMQIKNSETLEQAKKYIAEKGWEDTKANWDKQVANGQTSAEMVVVGQLLYNHALQTDNFDQAMNILVDYAAAVRNTAQALQATRILKKLGLEGAVLKANKDIDALTEKESTYKPKDGENFEQWKKKIKSDIGTLAGEIATVRDGDVGTLKDIILQIAQFRRTTAWFGTTERLTAAAQNVLNKLNFDDLKVVAETQLASIADDYRKRSKKEILQAIRKQNMLFSLKTILRNLTGNTAVGLGDAMSESGAGRMADFLLSKVTGKRTVGNDLTRAKQYFNGTKDALAFASLCVELNIPIEVDSQGSFLDAIGTDTNGKYIGKTFRANGNLAMRVMYAFQKAMSYNLEVSDRIFEGGVNAAVQESLQKITNSNLTEEEVSRLADFTAKKRTYKDATWKDEEGKTRGAVLSRKASDIVRPLGVFGDAVAPFVKVPMNVAQVGVDYTTGIVKGAGEIAAIIKDANAGKDISVERQRQAVSDFGRGLTGTAMIGLFAGAATVGILKAADGGDWDKEALEQAEGRSGAQINWDALGRWIQGEGAEWKEGDAITSLDFLEPFNTQMYLGYELSKAEGFGEVAWAFPHSALQSLMDSPMMTGLQETGDLVDALVKSEDAGDVADAAAGVVSDYATSYIPQWMRQTAQLADGYYRDTSGENVFQTAGNKFLAAIPGASQTLPMKYSGLGEPQQRGGFVSTFIDPTNTTQYNPNEITRGLEVIYGQTNDEAIYPERQAPKSVTVNGEKIMISGKEMTESYQKTYGEKNNELYGLLLSNPDFQALPAAMQADLLKKAKSYATEFAKAAVSDYEAPNETAQELTDKILGNAVVKQFTDAFTQNSAEGLDAAYNLYSGMGGDLRATVDKEGGKVGYFLTAKKAGVRTDTFLQLYDRFDLIRNDSSMTKQKQATMWAYELNRAAETGKITKSQADTLKTKMVIWQQFTAEAEKFNDMTDAGMSADAAQDISWLLADLKPAAGKTTVAYWQKAEAISGANISDEDKYTALITYGTDAQDKNLDAMMRKGYSVDDYVSALLIYSNQKKIGGKGTKDRTVSQLRRQFGIGKAAAEAIYNIYCGTDD